MDNLILVRHAQSEQHVRDITGGWTDVSLTETGRRQARSVGERLCALLGDRLPLARMYSSDLVRAAETAQIIGEVIGVSPQFRFGLRELGNGRAAGLTRAAAAAIALPKTDPVLDWVPYPEAESWRSMYVRVTSCMDEIVAECPESEPPLVIVTHGNSGVAIVQWWLGLCEACRGNISFNIDLASVTRLNCNEWNERTITSLNDTAHLAVYSDRKQRP